MKGLPMQSFQTAPSVQMHRAPHSAKPHSRILPQRGINMISRLTEQIRIKRAPVVVGLDPNLSFVPEVLLKDAEEKVRSYADNPLAVELLGGDLHLAAAGEAVWNFGREIIDSVADLVPAVKPQSAMYEQFGIPGIIAYQKLVRYAQQKGLIVIGDVKRGDIGSTSEAYARAHLGRIKIGEGMHKAFDEDFATVNPYLGSDGIEPFVKVCNEEDKGIFVLVKTSNPSSGEFQDVLLESGEHVYETVGKKVAQWGEASMDGDYSNVGAVVGATYPQQAETLRELMPHTFILAPGYGAQGASAKDLSVFFNKDGLGAIVNSSRGIIAAHTKERYSSYGAADFGGAARAAAIDMIEDLRSAITNL